MVGLAGKEANATWGSVAAVWRTNGSKTTILDCAALPDSPCRANAASNNGEVIGGWQQLENGFWNAATWKDGKQTLLQDADGQGVGEILAMNADGTVMTGAQAEGDRGANGWILRPGNDAVQILDGEDLFGASKDGSIAGGAINGFQGFYRTGYLWTPEDGAEDLLPALQRRQVPLPANLTQLDLGALIAVSEDGSVVAGWGMHGQMPTGWVAVLGEKSGTPVPPPQPGPGAQAGRGSAIGRTAPWPAEPLVV